MYVTPIKAKHAHLHCHLSTQITCIPSAIIMSGWDLLSSHCSDCLNGVGFMMLCSNCLCEVKSPEDQKHSNSFQFVMSWKADLGSASLTVDTAGCCHWGDCLDGASHSGLLAPWTEAQSYMLLKEVQFTPSVLFQHSSHSFYYICKICIEFSWLLSVKY